MIVINVYSSCLPVNLQTKLFFSLIDLNSIYSGEQGDAGDDGRKGEPGNAAGQVIGFIAEKGDAGDIGKIYKYFYCIWRVNYLLLFDLFSSVFRA